MKNRLLIFSFVVLFLSQGLNAQQLPDFTGFPSIPYQFNPAYSGTRSNIDARLLYRKQWLGYESAPIQQYAAVNSRFWKGRMGAGVLMHKDVTGPSQRFTYGFTAAYHLRFPDVELSAGIGMLFSKYTIDGSQMTTHWTNDPAVDYSRTDYDKTRNVSAGVLLYNDRFHFGLGVVNLVNNHAEFYMEDTTKKSTVNFSPHYYFTTGYNFHGHPDYVWENNVMALYVVGLPLTIHYNLRVHFREKIMAGATWRLKDAIALQAGYVFLDHFQVIYSYDIGISHLHQGHSGTHEFTLGYRWNIGGDKKGYKNFDQFQRQRYNIF
jgi:type IX secretion system PorP/SprF family membrane protein